MAKAGKVCYMNIGNKVILHSTGLFNSAEKSIQKNLQFVYRLVLKYTARQTNIYTSSYKVKDHSSLVLP
jgi:hypothetical protein